MVAAELAGSVITEAGFGADLGAEKFIDIKCHPAGLKPSVVVLVATIRPAKMHGRVAKESLTVENLDALRAGAANMQRHLHNVTQVYGLPRVVAINRFPTDTPTEIQLIKELCQGRRGRHRAGEACGEAVRAAQHLQLRV